jgi:four helix bundle protein
MEELRQGLCEDTRRPNALRDKAFAFSVRIIALTRRLKEMKTEASLVNQMLRSGTSISANVEEANAAISRAEFAFKLSIAFKEARETHNWLRMFKESGILSSQEYQSIGQDCEEILKLLWTILKTLRTKNN